MATTVAERRRKAAQPVDKHVGSRIRMRRMMLSMSQEKLADGLDLTFQQVQKYEKGTNRVGASRLQQISSILSVPVSFFFEGAPGIVPKKVMDDLPSPAIVSEFLSDKSGLAVAMVWLKLPITVRRKLAEMIETIAEEG